MREVAVLRNQSVVPVAAVPACRREDVGTGICQDQEAGHAVALVGGLGGRGGLLLHVGRNSSSAGHVTMLLPQMVRMESVQEAEHAAALVGSLGGQRGLLQYVGRSSSSTG